MEDLFELTFINMTSLMNTIIQTNTSSKQAIAFREQLEEIPADEFYTIEELDNLYEYLWDNVYTEEQKDEIAENY
jgi:hypothetical protein